MRLHDYPSSGNCYKVRLLLAQLGRDYERVDVDIFDGGTLTDGFGALNPTRTTPVLERLAARDMSDCANAGTARTVFAAHATTTSPIVAIQVLITRHETIFTAPKFAAMSLITHARRSG